MHANRTTSYGIPGKVERWCIYFFDKIIKLQQKGNRDNYVVINCVDGDAVCMNNRGRGIDQFPGGVTVQHGCPKNLMEGVGSKLSITIVVDVSFDNDKAAKNTVLKQLFSRFASAVPSKSNSNSIQLPKEVTATKVAATRSSSFLLQDVDPHGIVKKAIDDKAALLLSTCAIYDCNEKAIKGKQILCVCVCELYYRQFYYFYSLIIVLFYSLDTRLCKVCSNSNKECRVEECKNRRHSPERDCFYCLHTGTPKLDASSA